MGNIEIPKHIETKKLMGRFYSISINVVKLILNHCDYKELCALSKVNSIWKTLANDDKFWEKAARKEIPQNQFYHFQSYARESNWKTSFEKYARYQINKTPNKPTGGFFQSLKTKIVKAGYLNFGNKQIRIMMLGLDAAGKTTILYKLKLGEVKDKGSTISKKTF